MKKYSKNKKLKTIKKKKNYTTIEENIDIFLEIYKENIIDVINKVNYIEENIKLEVDCSYIDFNKVLVSYYLLFLIFIKNILDTDYQLKLKKEFYFHNLIINDTLIIEYNKEREIIENALKIKIYDINSKYRLNKIKIDILNNTIDDKCDKLKKAFSIIVLNGFTFLPSEIMKFYNRELYEHKLLYSSFTGFKTIEDIKKQLKYKCLVNFTIDNINHKYTIYIPNKTIYKKIHKTLLKRIAVQISFCHIYFGGTKLPNYTLYYTNLKKEVPLLKNTDTEVIFRSVHINTAVTDNNTDITIWRKEELLKSIFHEAIHFYNLDIKNKSFVNYFKNFILEKFRIDENSTIVIYESFTELNASILNAIFNSYYFKTTNNKKKISNQINISNIKKILYKEILFSFHQTSKIFKLNKYKVIEDFLVKYKKPTHLKQSIKSKHHKQKIKQMTDVISYHIIKSIFLFNSHQIYKINRESKEKHKTNKTNKTNTNFKEDINFTDTEYFREQIKHLIISSFKTNNKWYKILNKELKNPMSLKKNKSMRMTYYNNDNF